MDTKKLGIGLLVAVVLVGGYYYMQNQNVDDSMMMEDTMMEKDEETAMMMMESEVVEDAMMKETDDAMMMEMKDMEYAYAGELADVSESGASGTAMANYDAAGGYMLYVTFENLPALEDGFFYEGWVVRRGEDFSVISTGELELTPEGYVNTYASGTDLTDHTFYVLTLEPDDGDPAPADHVVEGEMMMKDAMMGK